MLLTAAVPSDGVPLKNWTVPVGVPVAGPAGATVAVRVTRLLKADGFGETVSLVVESAGSTVTAIAGEVLAVDVADGEQVGAGELILALQTGRPWLKATYYGADALAIHPGMTGRFRPASGAAVPVRVRTVSAALGSDDGEQVGLFPAAAHGRDGAALARLGLVIRLFVGQAVEQRGLQPLAWRQVSHCPHRLHRTRFHAHSSADGRRRR